MTIRSSSARRRFVVTALLRAVSVVAIGAGGTAALAQTYPARPIKFIVPYPPGGGTDIVARVIAERLQLSMGQPVVVENRPGASEVIGTGAVTKAVPDGYTIGLVSSTYSINPSLFPRLPYDSLRELAPITALVGAPMMVVVPSQSPVKNVSDLVALAKSQPGKLNYASLGPTSLHTISTEWFKHLAGIDMTAVGYKGAGPGLMAVAVDEVQFMFTGLAAGMAQVQGGKMRAIAVSTAKRLAALPDVPALAEKYPEFDVMPWYGVMAPAGTPSTYFGGSTRKWLRR